MAKKIVLDPSLKDVFRGSAAIAAGFVTKAQLQGPRFRRLFQDVYVRAEAEVTHELRCRGATLRVPPEAVLTGRSAATIRGAKLAKPYDPVEFVVPETSRFGPVAGMRIRRTDIRPIESKRWANARIARPVRIALDLIFRHAPRLRGTVRRLRTAVPDLDMFLRRIRIRLDKLKAECRRRRNWGVRLGRLALEFVDTKAESHPESELRVIMQCGGLRPTTQLNVHENGEFIGRLDLALEEDKLAVEYDGRMHDTAAQQRRDEERRQRLRKAGWKFVIVRAEHLATDYQEILKRIQLVRAGS
ncbi:DUF559 domain-containing protein [Amycolatopsis sp. 195334CR]|uniref:DUF559 domain-containing protein n=1 Tax=Amycolatopsis sp. 195334CR TaxID=2814588 RepID=UPI001A8F4EA8|nr:DUF559 domain-containing protein [Amycolatopsis sp. 195334CR]MBN6036359.1 DUF559 domain-containing protein [Amycolatopsis sp. 195334CR]